MHSSAVRADGSLGWTVLVVMRPEYETPPYSDPKRWSYRNLQDMDDLLGVGSERVPLELDVRVVTVDQHGRTPVVCGERPIPDRPGGGGGDREADRRRVAAPVGAGGSHGEVVDGGVRVGHPDLELTAVV